MLRNTLFALILLSSSVLSAQNYAGITGKEAPKWDIPSWIDHSGEPTTLSLSDFEGKKIVLFCFQSWCPGCHKSGFPTLQYLTDRFGDKEDIVFLAIQTVFEGGNANNINKLKKWQKKYKLNIPFGHDEGDDQSYIVDRYKTGGTPWFIVINEEGKVVYNDYELSPQTAFRVLK